MGEESGVNGRSIPTDTSCEGEVDMIEVGGALEMLCIPSYMYHMADDDTHLMKSLDRHPAVKHLGQVCCIHYVPTMSITHPAHSEHAHPPNSDILHILMRDEIQARRRRIRLIRLHRPPALERPILHHPSTRHARRAAIQGISSAQHRKVGQADLVRVAVDNGGQAEVARVDGIVADVQLKVSAIVQLAPLQFAVGADEPGAGVVGGGDGDVLPGGAGTRYGGPGEFHANGAFASGRVVRLVVEPD